MWIDEDRCKVVMDPAQEAAMDDRMSSKYCWVGLLCGQDL